MLIPTFVTMEKPDADGYIHVKWPSKDIPHGGIFHSKKVEPSAARAQFLKGLIEETKLSTKLRQKDAYNLRQEEEKVKKMPTYKVPRVRPRTSRRRSLSVIRESGAYEANAYRPLQRGEDREKLKDKLANAMAFGDTDNQPQIHVTKLKEKPKLKLPTAKEKWHDIMTQIRERAEWLAEMEYLGQGMQHREIIEDQIAERMRALKALGINSPCSTARSKVSEIGTASGREKIPSVRSNNSQKSVATNRSKGSHCPLPVQNKNGGFKSREENVTAYKQFPPLEYSPRRRV